MERIGMMFEGIRVDFLTLQAENVLLSTTENLNKTWPGTVFQNGAMMLSKKNKHGKYLSN